MENVGECSILFSSYQSILLLTNTCFMKSLRIDFNVIYSIVFMVIVSEEPICFHL